MGSASIGYSEIDDALDEGDETAGLALTNGTAANGATVVVNATPVTSTIVDNDQFAAGDPISATITTSAGDNPIIGINRRWP